MTSGPPDEREERVALRGLATRWDAARTERVLAGVHGRLGQRRRAWRAAIASVGVASVVAIAAIALRDRAAAPDAHVIRLREGSEIRLDPASADVRVLEESAARVRVDVVRGASRYVVVPNPKRAFEVRSGAVTVTVVGTEFLVERRGAATWVEVTRGKVRVTTPSGGDGDATALLGAGEAGLFPRERGPAVAPTVEEDAPGAGDAAREHARRSRQRYRSEIARRNYRSAYVELARNPAIAGDSVDDLLGAADVARLSDHPAEAVPYLQRILRDHPRDERAPMAAFTLGRTLSGLGRTREAMAQFARVRAGWPASPLAEDALVREAEAAAALGDVAAAVRLAREYDRGYPDGRRRSEVRRYARLE